MFAMRRSRPPRFGLVRAVHLERALDSFRDRIEMHGMNRAIRRPRAAPEREALVLTALLALDEEHRLVTVLHYLEGLDAPSVAQVLGLPIDRVRQIFHRSESVIRRTGPGGE
jgi:DNA-directed RNA polymerase specialized sigma24 family protein